MKEFSEVENNIKQSGGEQTLLTEKDFNRQLGQLAEKWGKQNGKDLSLRFKTGELLNQYFGPPDQRQKRGEEVLKNTAERLRTTQSELSRMRWFAHHFSDLGDFEQKHPEVKTWA